MSDFKLIQINETFAPFDPATEEFQQLESGDNGTIECFSCGGVGKIGEAWCNRCQGEGWVWVEEKQNDPQIFICKVNKVKFYKPEID